MTPFQIHLKERGLTDKIRCWIDETNEIVTFPLYNPPKWVGFQRYSWRHEKVRCNGDGIHVRYFTHITREYRPLAVWGTEYITVGENIYLTDGIFDSIRGMNTSRNFLACLGDSPDKSVIWWIRTMFQPKMLINIMDRDENNSGRRLAKLCDRYYIIPEPYKDLGEMSPEFASIFLDSLNLLTS